MLIAVPKGLGLSPGKGMDVYKCIMPLRHGSTLNNRRAACSLVRLEEREGWWEVLDHPRTDGHFIGFLCKAASSSATFVSITDALPDRFLSATDPLSRNRCTKRVIVDAFGAILPGYFC
ncbi:hypothetical protein TNCV_653061 [Trichonephila clavipes]|nr:hypothetical protein TNCV_653061 [Trichonephila clavipes]